MEKLEILESQDSAVFEDYLDQKTTWSTVVLMQSIFRGAGAGRQGDQGSS